jgi:hypothetical protein
MNTFLNGLKEVTNETVTEKGAKAYNSTKSAILDLFSLGGAVRSLGDSDLQAMIIKALDEDALLATRCIFYLADVRGGQGERRLFKVALPYLFKYAGEDNIIKHVPEFTRWSILFDALDFGDNLPFEIRSINTRILQAIYNEMADALDNNRTSLIFKWAPTPKYQASYDEDPITHILANQLDMSLRQYRKMLSAQRTKLSLVEKDMSKNKWEDIDYSKVPSKANLKYRTAFYRHDQERYEDFINKVNKGEVKMNASTLYPHEVISKIGRSYGTFKLSYNDSLEAMWKSLPDYLKDSEDSILPVIDTSGSMFTSIGANTSVQAIDVALGFGMYFAERLRGEFKNHFVNFSTRPKLNKLSGKTLIDRIKSINFNDWGGTTNIDAVFELILHTAMKFNMDSKDLPKKIIIFSDMQFDGSARLTTLDKAKEAFESNGYELPTVVFWNINARVQNQPATMHKSGVILVSGYSPSVASFILKDEFVSPYDFMLTVINSERYQVINF